jgi:glycolate oxidase iron-sulfur subunit
LRKCVHCGFCSATCPTYQLLGDELDSPRGRIYLIKQVLEGATPTRKTQLHLDRCLTCRNCETTCPSGVQYGHLVDIGRQIVDEQVPRPAAEKTVRWLLKEGLPSPLFAPAMKLGQSVRGLLPASLKAKVPAPQDAGAWPTRTHARKVLMLTGCVQPSMQPNINTATARVLDACGIQAVVAPEAGCCGAVKFHLNDHEGGKDHMRANIDAWWPLVERGEVEALVMNASGCGVMVKDYGHVLRDDPAYAAKAEADQMMEELKNHFIGEFGIAAWDQVLAATTQIKKDQRAAALQLAPDDVPSLQGMAKALVYSGEGKRAKELLERSKQLAAGLVDANTQSRCAAGLPRIPGSALE